MVNGNLLTSFAVILLFQSVVGSDHWSYPDRNATNVFPQWGGLCDTGNRQSPIDLSLSGALKGNFPDFEFHNYDKTLTSPSLLNNGHTVKLSNFNVQMTLTGGPLTDKFIVEEVHLHWWSEHTIDKIRYPMEAHIVHRNTRYANITEAASHKNGIAVVGVLFHASNEANKGIGKIIENIEFINSADEIGKPVKIEQKLNLREFFPKLSGGYLSYPGSLTTPSCAEAVTWIVLLDTFPVTLDQVNEFKGIETYGGKKLTDNYRDVQKKNNRPVLVVHQESSDAPASLRASTFSLIGSIVVLYISKVLQ
ncbi:carbonic anhydrase 2 [Episyrphus balteatus]|uniref:carbonic anhydrase 2 n=1 Tax=Episyrphus balteatus TaxID=286459 RepID=UPI002484F122|nr:carbonic anhydrase 2 [Episyrphus balteatus]XP_055852005.1 carbonic anhydrase 2 [Episyrphus balteatus]